MDSGNPALGFVAIIVVLALYFVPALVATKREHPQAMAILVLNVLLGWSVLGWVGALVWACTTTQGMRHPAHQRPIGYVVYDNEDASHASP